MMSCHIHILYIFAHFIIFLWELFILNVVPIATYIYISRYLFMIAAEMKQRIIIKFIVFK